MINIEEYYDKPVKTINFSVKDEDEFNMFCVCINSLYADIVSLNLKVNVETVEPLIEIINMLKIKEIININVTTKNEEEGLFMINNCIVLPGALSSLKDENIIEASPDYIQNLIDDIQDKYFIPNHIVVFNESEDLPQEKIPVLMDMVFKAVLKAIETVEMVFKNSKNK